VRTKKGSRNRKAMFVINKITKFVAYKLIGYKRPKTDPKVFCVGFIKTGTKSVAQLLKQLGYSHLSFNPYVNRDFQNDNFETLLQYSDKFDSFDDVPWNNEKLIPLLDQKYPGSKFIYLKRDEQEWLNSFKNWTKYLTDNEIDVDQWLNKFKAHRSFVENYFEGREEVIYIDVKNKTDLKRLLDFLGKNSSLTEFPHVNITPKGK